MSKIVSDKLAGTVSEISAGEPQQTENELASLDIYAMVLTDDDLPVPTDR